MIVLFNKPFNVLSQFTDRDGRATLADYLPFPGIRPAGRLDRDSEGLLVLTDNGPLIHRITQPDKQMSKTYWVQVEGNPSKTAVAALQAGVTLKDGPTRPARCCHIEAPANLWLRSPPIRVRKSVPDHWLELTISEGRNRQVRRMCAAVGLPVLRLIRYRVGSWTIDGIASGAYLEVGS